VSSGVTRALGAASAGLLFGAGLVVSGMTKPDKVLAFLNPFGAWDPSLAFVMIGAIGVHALSYRFSRRLRAPLAAHEFHVPAARAVDVRLVLGAATFGVGWGLAGYCPGPAVVALGSGNAGAGVFTLALLAGFLAVRATEGSARAHWSVHYTGQQNAGSEMGKGAPIP
jgi:uncharacterized membrane protein YedE/YeeE